MQHMQEQQKHTGGSRLYLWTRIGIILLAPVLFATVVQAFPTWGRVVVGAGLLTSAAIQTQVLLYRLMDRERDLVPTITIGTVILVLSYGALIILCLQNGRDLIALGLVAVAAAEVLWLQAIRNDRA